MKKLTRRLICLVLVVLMLTNTCAFAVGTNAGSGEQALSYTKDDSGQLAPETGEWAEADVEEKSPYADSDMVRVSIVLEKASTLEAGYALEGIAADKQAMQYRANLESNQASVASRISTQALNGQKLDVVWNLTLAANLISANVAYGDIEKISQVPGVAEVVLETRYLPQVLDTKEAANPMMATSSAMIGSAAVWAAGYTGAGSRVAVIDTGIDTDHQSFSAGAFEYALAQNAAAKGESEEAYLGKLDLLDKEEVSAAFSKLALNARNVTADQLYLSSKIPFAYNYIDEDLDVTHENDKAGEHGSHVAGIAVADRYIPDGDGYAPALDAVQMQGVAPDAQLIVMKVFGKNGGAYDSDYMAAIEDAIILGCDSINLSLGSSAPGFSYSVLYQELMESLPDYGAVITMSAGNAGYWAENASGLGYLYSEDVSMDMLGSPSSFDNSLSIASVNNIGYTANYVTVNGENVLYSERLYGNESLLTLAGEHEYILIDGIGSGEEFAAVGDALKGRIAVCSRGTTSFVEKASRAAMAGAIATMVANNEDGIFGMDLTDYKYTQPCVSLSMDGGQKLKAAAEPVKDDNGSILYYKGTLTVATGITSQVTPRDYNVMSSFSSWGVPGSLTLKPEITAPGGSIYSVDGSKPGGQAYETMSGTSMSAPQVAGMTAILAQYIRENGLEAKTGRSKRQLIQSLLMSTAEPVLDGTNGGAPYSVLQQGAGLANVGNAASARSYIWMDDNATASAADGKVKVELGDDKARQGTYSFSFTLNNMTEEARRYTLSSDIFTQNVFSAVNSEETGTPEPLYLDTKTAALGAAVSYTVNGQPYVLHSAFDCDLDKDGDTDADDAQVILDYAAGLIGSIDAISDLNHDGTTDTYDAYLLLNNLITDSFSLPANGSVQIGVTITLTDSAKAQLNKNTPNGAYVEGYVYVSSVTTLEGEIPDSRHSIPIMGFYGDWTDPAMFDRQNTTDYFYGETIQPYTGIDQTNNLIYRHRGSNQQYWKLGNPYVIEDQFRPERNAIQSSDTLYAYGYTLIRNAAAMALVITDADGSIIYHDALNTTIPSAFYYSGTSSWEYINSNYPISKIVRTLGIPENEKFTVSLVALPEYAAGRDLTEEQFTAMVSSGELGKGVELSTTLTVDDTAPELLDVSKSLNDGSLTLKIRDNQYLALARVTNVAGSIVFGQATTTQQNAGDEAYIHIELENADKIGPNCKIVLADYAGNMNVYDVAYGGEPEDYSGRMYGFITGYRNNSGSGKRWIEIDPDKLTDRAGAILACDMSKALTADISAAEYVNGYVYMAVEDGCIYVAPQGDWANLKLVGRFLNATSAITDMAYDTSTGTLYAMGAENHVYTVNTVTGALTPAFTLTITNPQTTQANKLVLRTLAIDDNGTFYSVNNGAATDAFLYKWTAADITDGKVTDLAPVGSAALGKPNFFGTMAWDHDKGILYWASAMSFMRRSDTSGNNRLMIVNTENGTALESVGTTSWGSSTLNAIASGLYVVPKNGGTSQPSEQATAITLDKTSVDMLTGMELQLKTDVYPWNLKDDTVSWSSADPAVATVDAQGYVRAIAPGSTVITATTNAAPNLTANCTVNVSSAPSIQVTGLVYENGKASWQEFNITDPTSRTAVAEAESDYIGGALLDDGIIVQDGRKVYSVDPDTFATTELNPIASDWIWSDAAPAPITEDGEQGKLVALCSGGTQIEVLDPLKGTLNVFTYINEHLADPMAAIAYTGSGYGGSFNTAYCTYVVITEGGELYGLELGATSNNGGSLKRTYLGSTGLTLGDVSSGTMNCYASMVYDQESHYLVLANRSGGSATDLILIDPETCLAAKVSSFEDGTWPVVSLYQYTRVTELTVRVRPMKNNLYVGDRAEFTARILPESFEGGVVWSSSDETIATVDQNGVVTGVSAGATEITATSVAAGASGKHATASGKVVVKPLIDVNVKVNAQVTTDEGTYWAEIDTSKLSSFVKKSGKVTTFSGGGAHDGKLYGSDWDFDAKSYSNLYMTDPADGYKETSGTEVNAVSSIIDLATAPKATYSSTYPTKVEQELFGQPLMLVAGQGLFFLTDFEEGSESAGWGFSSVAGSSGLLCAIAYKNMSNYAPYNFAEYFYALDKNGILFEVRIAPMYQSGTGTWQWSISASPRNDIGLTFDDYTKVSMEYIHDGSVNGLLIAYSGNGIGELYWHDLNSRVTGKIGNVADSSMVKCLYTDKTLTGEGLTSASDKPFTFVEGTAETASSMLLMSQNYDDQVVDLADEARTVPTGSLNAIAASGSDYYLDNAGASMIDLKLTAKNSTNGLIEVTYDAAVLSVASVSGAQVYYSANDKESGKVRFAFAAPDAVNGAIGTVTFRYDRETCPDFTTVTVTTLEDGASKPGNADSHALVLRHTEPSRPEKPAYSSKNDTKDCPAASYKDVDTNRWYHEGIDFVLNNGLMNGISTNTFAPDGLTSRAMVVTVLYRLAGAPAVSGTNPFKDVAAGSWYEKAVIWGYQNGVVMGMSEDTFAPNTSVNREQLATLICRYAALNGKDVSARTSLSTFADGTQVSAWAQDAVSWAVAEGLIEGTSRGLEPFAGATRAQFATILMRYCK